MSKPQLTHPEKLLYPDSKITKQDIYDYYLTVSEYILPYIKDRLLTVLRCPRGYQNTCFIQKHLAEHTMTGLEIQDDYFYLEKVEGLMSLTQLDVLEIHTWGSCIQALENPNIIIFDLDPAPEVPWANTVMAAKFLNEQLQQLNLQSFVKTTGSKGLHIHVPIIPEYSWDEVKAFTKNFAEQMVLAKPDWFTANLAKTKRKNKIFIDYLRNARGATAVAPYSTRAKAHAPIALPIAWESLNDKFTADKVNLSNIKQYIADSKEAWQNYFQVKQKLILN